MKDKFVDDEEDAQALLDWLNKQNQEEDEEESDE